MELSDEARKAAAIETVQMMKERWTSSIVPRTKVPEFTGGLFSVGHLANSDSKNRGPEGGFRIGRQKCYPINSLLDWLVQQLEA